MMKWPDEAVIAVMADVRAALEGVSHFKDCIASLPIATGNDAVHKRLYARDVGPEPAAARTVWLAEVASSMRARRRRRRRYLRDVFEGDGAGDRLWALQTTQAAGVQCTVTRVTLD